VSRAPDDLRQRRRGIVSQTYGRFDTPNAFLHFGSGLFDPPCTALTMALISFVDPRVSRPDRGSRPRRREAPAVFARLCGDDGGVQARRFVLFVISSMTWTIWLICPTLRCRSSSVSAVLLVTSREMLIPATVSATAPTASLSVFANLTRDVSRRLRAGPQLGDGGIHLRYERQHFLADSGKTSARSDISLIEAFISVVDDDVFSTD